MIRHIRVSDALTYMKDAMFQRWGLSDAKRGVPVVMLGIYTKEDARFFNTHKGHVTVLWAGSDANKKHTLRRKARHIAKSECICRRLRARGIRSEVIPVTSVLPHVNIQPAGDKIFFYGKGKKYGEQYIDEVERRTGIEVIRTRLGMYDDMDAVYRQCFIGLRLTPRDGLPKTVIEMGLMGRRSVFNGGLPGSIPWRGVDDICKSIMAEKGKVHEDVAKQMYNYIDISNEWLKYI